MGDIRFSHLQSSKLAALFKVEVLVRHCSIKWTQDCFQTIFCHWCSNRCSCHKLTPMVEPMLGCVEQRTAPQSHVLYTFQGIQTINVLQSLHIKPFKKKRYFNIENNCISDTNETVLLVDIYN